MYPFLHVTLAIVQCAKSILSEVVILSKLFTDVVMFLLLLMTMYTILVYLPPRLSSFVTFISGY